MPVSPPRDGVGPAAGWERLTSRRSNLDLLVPSAPPSEGPDAGVGSGQRRSRPTGERRGWDAKTLVKGGQRGWTADLPISLGGQWRSGLGLAIWICQDRLT